MKRKIYYTDCGMLQDVMAAEPVDATLSKALFVLNNIWSTDSFMGIEMDHRFILQISPVSRLDYFYAEILDTQTRQITWTIVSLPKAERMIQCVYSSEPILNDPVLKKSRWRSAKV
ncbi:MAG: hypothetical protein ACOYCD_00040 [Kiritimatiellia bacterium]|jgi:hypothetical protein